MLIAVAKNEKTEKEKSNGGYFISTCFCGCLVYFSGYYPSQDGG
jgi:hypothetical protein